MEYREFIEGLEEIAREFHYQYRLGSNRMRLSRDETLLTVTIEFHEDKVFIYLYARTTSWDGAGDRSDMNDMFSTLPAIFLRIHEPFISSTLLDIEHPLGQGDGGAIQPVELYARYLVFSQPFRNGILPRSKETLETIRSILGSVTVYETNLFHFMESDPSVSGDCIYKDTELTAWGALIVNALGEDIGSEKVLFNKRINPHWLYFRSIDSGVSVFRVPNVANLVRQISKKTSPWNQFATEEFVFYKSNAIFNGAERNRESTLTKVIERLEGDTEGITFVPLENRLIAIGGRHIAIVECECDQKEYIRGKEIVINRRKQEQEFLFGEGVYKWSSSIDGERFEDLVRDLLYRKEGVLQVKRISVTNEADGNADLVCIWDTVSLSDMPHHDDESPIQRRKVVVQCKAWSKNIGKNDLPSIRDTLDRFDATGMLVVTSKQIARSLFEHIEVLRRKGIWADFWNRADIESMLDEHPDLVSRYKDIVSFAKQT